MLKAPGKGSKSLARMLWTAALLMGFAQVSAYEPVLSAAEVERAIQVGTEMVSPSSGYRVQDYLLHEYVEGVRLRPDDPEVNAITLSTPFEALRYNAYVAKYQRKALSPEEVREITAETAHTLTANVYAHSPFSVEEELEQFLQAYEDETEGDDAEQQSFLDFYSDATLEIGDQTLTAQKAVNGPYQDQFSPFGGTPEFRFLGVVRYTFDLSGVDTKGKEGTLTFTDFSERQYTDVIRFDEYK